MVTKVNYANFQQTAERLITKFGRDAKIVRENVVEGTSPGHNNSATAPTEYPIKIVRINFNVAREDGQVVQQGDCRYLMSVVGVSIEPKAEDLIYVGTETWAIQEALPVTPGGTVILWDLLVRKWPRRWNKP